MCSFIGYANTRKLFLVSSDYFIFSGYDKALQYEMNRNFGHAAACASFYSALWAGMDLPEVQSVPKNMNKKGYTALCNFFAGTG